MVAATGGLREAGERTLSTVGKRTGPAGRDWLPAGVREWFDADGHPATVDLFKGVVAGVAGGLIGAWAMNQFHARMSSNSEERSSSRDRQKRDAGTRGDGPVAEEQGKRATDSDAGQEPATVQVAEAVSRTVAQHELTSREKRVAGPAVHYAYGAAVGGLYGGIVEAAPVVQTAFGTAYGTALWLIGDEIAVPGLGMGKPPTEAAPAEHAQALAAHLVYGATLEGVRRLVRRVL